MTAVMNILRRGRKGGGGKSLIAGGPAFRFERPGIPAGFFGPDSQGGTVHKPGERMAARAAWRRRRLCHETEV